MPTISDARSIGSGAMWMLIGLLVVAVDIRIGDGFDLLPDVIGAGIAMFGGVILLRGIQGAGNRGQAVLSLLAIGGVVAVLESLGVRDGSFVMVLNVVQVTVLPVLAFLLRDVFATAGRRSLADLWGRNLRYTMFGLVLPVGALTIIAANLAETTTNVDEMRERLGLALVILLLAVAVFAAFLHSIVALGKTAALRNETA